MSLIPYVIEQTSRGERSYDIYLAIFIPSLTGGSDGKAPAYSEGDPGSILGSGRFPW